MLRHLCLGYGREPAPYRRNKLIFPLLLSVNRETVAFGVGVANTLAESFADVSSRTIQVPAIFTVLELQEINEVHFHRLEPRTIIYILS